jgi:DNA-binding response OmpR family regulator
MAARTPIVLIADDDATTAQLLQILLEMEGFEAVCENDGLRVIASMEERKPAAVLVDFYLQGTVGTELVREIRRTPSIADTPVIMLSGLEKTEEAVAAGANRFLLKPFEPSDLISMLHDLT